MVFADETKAQAPEIEMAAASEVDGTTISFWHSMGGVNGQAIDTLVQKFNEENEYGITVEAEYQGSYDDALNKLKSAQMGNMGADVFDLEWVQATINLFTLFGWALFVAGTVVAVFDVAVEYQNGRANIKTTAINVLKGFFACSSVIKTRISDLFIFLSPYV